MSDIVNTMILNRIANNQAEIAFDLQQQIAMLRAELADERQRNADLAHENSVLKARNTSLEVQKKIWRGEFDKAKARNESLESEVGRMKEEVTEHRRKARKFSMNAIVHEACALGYAAQVEQFKSHHPDSTLLEEVEVAGRSDLGKRTPLQTSFDVAYSERFRFLGVSGAQLESGMASFDIKLPFLPAYIDNEPDPAPDHDAEGPKPAT